MNTVKYEYHHAGIPTDKPQVGERYSPTFKMYTTSGHNEFRIQWHRFEKGCPLHPLIQTVPHIAFKVDSIDKAKNRFLVLRKASLFLPAGSLPSWLRWSQYSGKQRARETNAKKKTG